MKMTQIKLGRHCQDWTVRADADNVLHCIAKTSAGEVSRPWAAVTAFVEQHGSIDFQQFSDLAAMPKKQTKS